MSAADQLFEDFQSFVRESQVGRHWIPKWDEDRCIRFGAFATPRGNDGSTKFFFIVMVRFTDADYMGVTSFVRKGIVVARFSSRPFAKCEAEDSPAVLLKLNELNGEASSERAWLDLRDGTISAETSVLVAGEEASRVCLWHALALEAFVRRVLDELGDLAIATDGLDGLFGLLQDGLVDVS